MRLPKRFELYETVKIVQSRQKSYAELHQREMEFNIGDHMFLKVSLMCSVTRFGIKGKLAPRYVEPFKIVKRISDVAYRLNLLPQLSHVHNVFHVSILKKYTLALYGDSFTARYDL